MFNIPDCGWVSVKIGGRIFGYASYLTNPIYDTIYELSRYVSGESDTFCITYDGKGYEFGIATIGTQLYVFVDKDKLRLYPIETHDRDKSSVAIATKLLKKAMRNLDDYKYVWVHWFMDGKKELDRLGNLGREALKRLE